MSDRRTGDAEARRTRSDAVRNREAIVAAGARELKARSALSMRAVAAAAGVSHSTLYRHFPTRASIHETLREESLASASRAVEAAVTDDRPPLAALRQLVASLAAIGSEVPLGLVGALPLGARGRVLAERLAPLLDRLRVAAEVAPALPGPLAAAAGAHLIEVCLRLGADGTEDEAAVDDLFRSLTEPLDRGLTVLDPDGLLLAVNPLGTERLGPHGRVEIGTRLVAPRGEFVYEDGSPCPADAYPLAAAVRMGESRVGVRGHRDDHGGVSWISAKAYALRMDPESRPYAIVGVLSDVTAQKRWELERLRPAGRLGRSRPVQIDTARVLDEIPPHLFPEQFASEARRITGTPVALYVLDIDGSNLLRLAGAEEFPARLDAPLSLGPELAPDGIPDLYAHIESELPGAVMAPMWLRARAVGLLLAVGGSEEELLELARHGAAAMELADCYTDTFEAARRRKQTTAAAELQQSLVPPRIARIGSGEVAGSVLPSYEVGGDWFDYVENRNGAWLAIADAAGKGATAGALGGIALAALRAARRSDRSLEEAAQSMHEVVFDVGRPEFFVTAIVGRWHAVYSTFSWINCGHPPPLVVRADDSVEQLVTASNLPLGLMNRERRFTRHQRRLDEGERLILHSDGVTARRTDTGLFGVHGIATAVRQARSRSATSMARAIQEAVVGAALDPLQDDVVAVVLAPTL